MAVCQRRVVAFQKAKVRTNPVHVGDLQGGFDVLASSLQSVSTSTP